MDQETILIVDDSSEIRNFLTGSILNPAGYNVLAAVNGSLGLKKILDESPDLVLLDINIPGMTGLEILEVLKQKGIEIPVIVITSHGSAEIILQSFRLGAKDFVEKPFTADDVLDAVDKTLAETRWMKERGKMSEALYESNRQLQKQVEIWERLNEVGRGITATLNAEDAQRRLMRGFNQLMQVEAGSLFLFDDSTEELVLKVSLRGSIEKLNEIRLKPGEGIAGWALMNGKSVYAPEAYKDKRFIPGVDQCHTGSLTRSVLAVPLFVNKKIIGVIEVLNPIGDKDFFELSDLRTLETLALSVAVAVENAHLYDLMRESISIETLKKTMVTVSHYINNSLTVTMMIANLLKERAEMMPVNINTDWLFKSANALHIEGKRISDVINVLNRMTRIEETTYFGKTSMIEIKEELKTEVVKD